jgi:crotonobetainyl-CoA:carnitine CoA-transferase CaiB-like acyl-CoA transferase
VTAPSTTAGPPPAGPTAPAALEGVTVVDFTRQMSGPYASLVLGDFGADVIKIESAPKGDGCRYIGNTFVGGESTMFLTWNRNKRSVCLDLRQPEGLEVALRLIDRADVVMENYRPGVADEIGIGGDAVLERNPRAIYCSVNAFGSEGPWAGRPGTDPVVQAMSGVMSVTGEREGGPLLVGIPVADYSSAMLAVQGVLLGLLARQTTGRGQKVEIPMLHALAFGLTTRVGPYFANGEEPTRWGSQHSQVVPYQAFQTKDGYAVSGTWGDADWPKFCDGLGWPELADDPRYDNNVKRVALRDELSAKIQERFTDRTTAEWEERFSSRKVLFAPVNTFSELFNHPQAEAMKLVIDVEHPTAGVQRQLAPAVRMAGTPARVDRPSPLLGQHTEEVLLESGWSRAEVDGLVARGVAKVGPTA